VRRTKSAKPQPEYYKEIRKLEKQIPQKDLKKLQKEADLREYSDWEYLDLLKGYIDSPEGIKPE
jgi:hypothetical protein